MNSGLDPGGFWKDQAGSGACTPCAAGLITYRQDATSEAACVCPDGTTLGADGVWDAAAEISRRCVLR